jgi:CheY-like chemotaxis protein
MKNGTVVLVVEDMPQVRATAVSILERIGCVVLDAYNGHDAVQLLKAHPEIAVLFTDVRMPGMDGFELAQRLRPDLRVVLTSGYISTKDVPDELSFVPKPWRAEALAAAVVGPQMH